MSGTVEHFGLVFRSASHFHWLIMSLVLLSGNALLQIPLVKDASGKQSMLWFPVIFHLATVAEALVFTRLGTVNGPTFSVDCIWFNTLMALINALVILRTNRAIREQRSVPESHLQHSTSGRNYVQSASRISVHRGRRA